MSVLNQIAFYQERRDEVPNQDLARELVNSKDKKGIQEIADNLWNKNKSIRSDCLKVLYEIGYLDPGLIENHTEHFLKLLTDKDNRMIWGAMIGLATVADKRADQIWPEIDTVIQVVEQGTVITVVWGVRVLAKVAARNKVYQKKLFPVLLEQLRKCIPRDVPTHAESIRCAVNDDNKAKFLATIDSRRNEMSPSHLARLKKALKGLG